MLWEYGDLPPSVTLVEVGLADDGRSWRVTVKVTLDRREFPIEFMMNADAAAEIGQMLLVAADRARMGFGGSASMN